MDNITLKYEPITKIIIGCAFDVIKELGAGFIESVYQKALVIALKEKGLIVNCQHPISVKFRGQIVGEFFADILVEEKVFVELKATKMLIPEHEAQ